MASGSSLPETALAAAGIVGQWEIDADTRSVKLDRAGARFLYGNELQAGVPFVLEAAFVVVHPDDRGRLLAHCNDRMENGGPSFHDHRLDLPHFGPRHVQSRGYFGRNKEGRMIGRGVVIDISEHVGLPVGAPRVMPALPRLPFAPLFDPLAEAAAHSIEVREALGESGHGALRLAADLLLWEINTALAERYIAGDEAG